MNTQKDIRAALHKGITVKIGNVEIVDLRHVMDQYSDSPAPVIQISSVKKVPFSVMHHKGGATAGSTLEVSRLLRSEEKISEALSKWEG
jgi:hypothetical protein